MQLKARFSIFLFFFFSSVLGFVTFVAAAADDAPFSIIGELPNPLQIPQLSGEGNQNSKAYLQTQ